MTRRIGLAAIVALGMLGTSGLHAQEAPEEFRGTGKLIVNNWGGPTVERMHEAWYGDFSKASGIDVSFTSIPDVAKLKIMNQVGNVEWDVVDFEGSQMLLAMQDDLLAPIDYDLMYKLVPKAELDPAQMTKYGIGSIGFSTIMAWNTETVGKKGPATWAEFFDTTAFPGRRALYARPKPTLEIALMADGVAPKDVYPIDIDRAFAALDKIGPKVNLWVEKTSQWDVLIQNKEVDLMGSGLARTMAQIERGEPIAVNFNQSIMEQSYWTIPKNAPNVQDAQKLIAWMMLAEGERKALKLLPYYSMANMAALNDMPKETLAKLPGSPENAANSLSIDAKWWLEHDAEVQTRWLDWISRQ
ncbi:ABC transporter substrate-binding protein [Pararhizobium polonicum]|uniref:ABC transporter substrate-binding protein n=1 Tax=Pararhizobium polonicum TaxID=1612624 RepID=UPI00083AAFA5|nr:ABC transporter substrate-binding protein [Pararhizobium polonicum]